MRNIESLVKPEFIAMLKLEVNDEMMDQLSDEQRDAFELEFEAGQTPTVGDMLAFLFHIAEVVIPERLVDGEEIDKELVDSTVQMIPNMAEIFTEEGYAELMGLYTALLNPVPVVEPVTPVEDWHSRLVEVGMTDLGVLSLEQTRAMDNGTGYVDNYTKLFDRREDGYYHADAPIATEIFVCREAMPRNRLVVMIFRNGKPCGSIFQRFTDNLDIWTKCELAPDLEKLWSENTGKESLRILIKSIEKPSA